jgi:hypothetical protein
MAKLYAELEDEKGIEMHKIANKQLCADFYYGSKENSIKALTVCATVKPSARGENVEFITQFVSPAGYPIHTHREEFPLFPPTAILVKVRE